MKNVKFLGLPPYLAAVLIVICVTAMYMGALPTDLGGAFAIMLSIGVVFNEIGKRIPIWNTYIGGGLVLAFLGSSALVYFNVIPKTYVEAMNWATEDANFLTLFIVILITGSILGLERKLLLKSMAGYIPAILGGVAGAALLGIITGLLFGINPADVVIRYVLPVMGGGNGAGAVPLSQIYEKTTGQPAASYYSFAITILTIANIFAIIAAGLLNGIGKRATALTGDGKTLMRNSEEIAAEKDDVKLSMIDYGGAFLLSLTFYALGCLFSEVLLPTIFGVQIHTFAYMIVFVVIANALGLIPAYVRKAATVLQSFFTKNMILIIMVGVGIDTDLGELASAITFSNVVMALMIIIGAILGSAIIGYLVGFYPIDSAVTAGLCMANRGGSGDLAVLGASERMDLISYAQLSSRLGGGLVLVIGSIVFGMFL
ncbi:2-hydroxycarboxylate transporter family protein [Streptococcus pantholopis]|uniref:Damage-inducible protein CinA n=1 Tax=Streptococcus pantholopis TaxID=1811193 RepID=A0A172Q8D4_9STRE|nr:2-hydroxycarboxylate transporter family protein [Streptococcus pantholopis]AND79655.1 damage-inducible protein CinA [Streptococcus pantholopis]